jgi:hypothetical protein
MRATEAAELIDAVAASLWTDPAQFHIAVSVEVGENGSVGYDFARARGMDVAVEQLDHLLAGLRVLARELRAPEPDGEPLTRMARELAAIPSVPDVVVCVMRTALSLADVPLPA